MARLGRLAMPHETLIVKRDGPVLKLTLNRPDVRNALAPPMVAALGEAFQQARDDESVRVVVLMGAGRNFCAGGDFRNMEASDAARGGSKETTAANNRRFGTLLEMADALPKAVIALIEGAAMGGGIGLVSISDWAIAEKSAQLGTPEVTVGLVPAQIAPFVVARIGVTQARRLASYGLRIDAGEAQRIGLVHEVADDQADLMTKGVAAINQCLRCSPQAIADTKKLVHMSAREPLWASLDQASHMFAAALAGDAKEGIRAFLDKRKPAWVTQIEKL